MKRKMMKKCFTVALAATLATASLLPAACTAKKISNDDNTLEVYIWNQGYGTEWLGEALKDFGTLDYVKNTYPNYKYGVVINDQQSFTASRIGIGSGNTIDLFFGADADSMYGDDSKLLDLTEVVYGAKVLGENTNDTVKDRMRTDIMELLEYRPVAGSESAARYYSMPWALGTGIIAYNETLFEKMGLEVPNTTDEMFAVMEQVKTKNSNAATRSSDYPYTHTVISSKVSYAAYMYHVWWAQYEGMKEYVNYFNGIDYEGYISPEVLLQDGRVEAMKLFEKMYKLSSGYFDASSVEYEFVAGQGRLLTGNGLMMINGDWFSCEMADMAQAFWERGYQYKIGTMKTPVISSIVNKTPSLRTVATSLNKTVDKVLSDVVAEIDAGATVSSIAGIEQDDFDLIRTARGTIYSMGISANTVIPSYATAKNLAVDFLRYLASDRANEIYAKGTFGGRMAFTYNLQEDSPELYAELSQNSLFEVQSDVLNYLSDDYSHLLPLEQSFDFVKYGGFSSMSGFGNLEIRFMNDGNLTAAQIIRERYDYWTANGNARWDLALNNAGML